VDEPEYKRRVTKAYQMAAAELRDRHKDEFFMLYDFYREYLEVPRMNERHPKRPPAPTSTRKGKQQ
jgi:hypothetical protein